MTYRKLSLAICLAGAVAAGRTDAAVLPQARIDAALASAKNLHREAPPTAGTGLPYYAVRGSDASGYLNPDVDDYGYLANGTDLLIVPMLSGGSGGVFYTLLFTSIATTPAFIGYLPSPSGHLDAYIDEGLLVVATPVYKGNDPNCCPSAHHVVTYTVTGTKLRKVAEYDRS